MYNSRLIFITLTVLFTTSLAQAQTPGRRPHTSEFAFRFNYVEAEQFSGPKGASLQVEDDLGFGFGFLYNQSEHWALGGSFDWVGLDYTAFAKAEDPANEDFEYSNRMYNYSLNFDTVYYLLNKSFTPFVSGSLGWTTIDTNIATGPGYNYCWWDYWGGYYCSTYRPTKSESGLSYKLGLGLRWDLNRDFSIKGSYQWSEINIDVAGENPTYNTWRLELVSNFY